MTNLQTTGTAKGSTIDLGWNHDGAVQFILTGSQGRYYCSTDKSLADWMDENFDVLKNWSLRELSISGSHDAGMSERYSGTPFGTECSTLTQSKNIEEQLMLGTRYFDIRPVITAGKYRTGHYGNVLDLSWQGSNGESIHSIVEGVNAFLKNRHELVILNLSHDLNTDVGNSSYRSFTRDEWLGLFKELSDLDHLYRCPKGPQTDLTTLPLHEFLANGPAIVAVVKNAPSDMGGYEGNGFYRYQYLEPYDAYSNTNNLEEMRKDQLEKMRIHSTTEYFLLSWTLTQSPIDATFSTNCIKKLAKEANQWLAGNVYSEITDKSFPNIIYTDYIETTVPAVLALAANWKRHTK